MNNDNAFKFAEEIRTFNKMYGLPTPEYPTLDGVPEGATARLVSFSKTLTEEVEEILDVLALVGHAQATKSTGTQVAALTAIADWLADIQIYAASEMTKFGLNNDQVLRIVCESNLSKRQADGSTAYNENGKVLKGPNFFPPEPAIEQHIRDRLGLD